MTNSSRCALGIHRKALVARPHSYNLRLSLCSHTTLLICKFWKPQLWSWPQPLPLGHKKKFFFLKNEKHKCVLIPEPRCGALCTMHLGWKGLDGATVRQHPCCLVFSGPSSRIVFKICCQLWNIFVMEKSSQFTVKFDLEELPKVILNYYWEVKCGWSCCLLAFKQSRLLLLASF